MQTLDNIKTKLTESKTYKQKPENLDKITESKIKKLTKNNLIISQNSYTEII